MSHLAADDRYTSMQYRRSGSSGLSLPALSLGLWHNFGHGNAFAREWTSSCARSTSA